MVASSLWPMIPLIVPISKVGTAFGTIQSIQNLGIGKDSIIYDKLMTCSINMETQLLNMFKPLKGLLTLAVGALADKGWFPMEIFFFSCSICKIYIDVGDRCC